MDIYSKEEWKGWAKSQRAIDKPLFPKLLVDDKGGKDMTHPDPWVSNSQWLSLLQTLFHLAEVAKVKQLHTSCHQLPKGKSQNSISLLPRGDQGAWHKHMEQLMFPTGAMGLVGLIGAPIPPTCPVNWEVQRQGILLTPYIIRSQTILLHLPLQKDGSSEKLEIYIGLSILPPSSMSIFSPSFWGLMARIMERVEVSITSLPHLKISRWGLRPLSSLFLP